MATNKVKWISEGWLADRKASLPLIAKTITTEEGETIENPRLAEAKAEIEEAEYHLAAKNQIIEKAAAAGYRVNSYEGRCSKTGVTVKRAAGFVRKENGKWITYSREVVIEELGITIVFAS